MKRAAYVFLLSVFMITSCSKPVNEEQPTIRLPAETAEEKDMKVYDYLQKTELRNNDVIARPYFFKEGTVDDNQASYSEYGITAEISLQKADTTDITVLLEEKRDAALQKIKEQISVESSEIDVREEDRMIEISYMKEITQEEKDKRISYQYPCKCIIKADALADGNYLLIFLEIDNEETVQMTEILLQEFLDAHGITFG